MINDRERISELLARKETRVTWLFAGDSITHGAYHTYGARDYVEHFAERVRYEMDRRFDTIITTATSGWTIENIKNELDWAVLRHAPAVVSLNIGMNDAKASSPDEFRRDFVQVLETIRGRTNAALILHTPIRILAALDELRGPRLPGIAEVIRQTAQQFGAGLVDHDAEWGKTESAGKLAYWLGDTIHPNAHGHIAMAHLLLRELGMWDQASNVCRFYVP